MPWLSVASRFNPSPNFVFFSLFVPCITNLTSFFSSESLAILIAFSLHYCLTAGMNKLSIDMYEQEWTIKYIGKYSIFENIDQTESFPVKFLQVYRIQFSYPRWPDIFESTAIYKNRCNIRGLIPNRKSFREHSPITENKIQAWHLRVQAPYLNHFKRNGYGWTFRHGTWTSGTIPDLSSGSWT